jgi:hypothetical protein
MVGRIMMVNSRTRCLELLRVAEFWVRIINYEPCLETIVANIDKPMRSISGSAWKGR